MTREESDRAVRHVADAVAIEVVAAIVVPVVAGERRRRRTAVGGDVEAVADEVVPLEAAVYACSRRDAPPSRSSMNSLSRRRDAIGAVGEQRRSCCRTNTLCSSRASLISLSSSPYAAAPQLSSNRLPTISTPFVYMTATPGPVVAEGVLDVPAVVGIHEVQPVAEVASC